MYMCMYMYMYLYLYMYMYMYTYTHYTYIQEAFVDVSGNRCAVSCILEADVIDTDVFAMCGVEDMWEYNTEDARHRHHCSSAAASGVRRRGSPKTIEKAARTDGKVRASKDFVNNTGQNSNFLPLGMMAAALKKDLGERKWQYCDA